MNRKRTAAIILNYNDSLNTLRLISQFKHYGVIDKILVVDNSDRDGLDAGLPDFDGEKIILITNPNNGYAAGNNAGLDYLKEKFGLFDYIIISNPDIEVHLQAIEACRDFLENHDTMALAAPRMHGPDGLPHHLSGWKERTFLCDLAYSSGLLSRTVGMYRETYPESYFQGEYSRVDCAAGSFFMIKGPVFYEIGKFDPNTFLYYEEDILGVRIKRAGYEEAVLNRFGFTHFEGTSVNRSLSMVKKYLTMQKSRIYFQRHYRRINFAQLLVLYAATLLGLTEKLVKAVFYRFHDGHPAA